jgi:thiol-disulfide isomerase/thioredoxin
MAKKTILLMSGMYCSPCRVLAPIVEKVCTEMSIPVRHIDVDAYPELVKLYKIQSIPTLILMDGDEPVKRIVGNTSEARLREWLA